MTDRRFLLRFAWLSIGAALLTITLKAGAYLFTGSVGLLSDALESGINLVAGIVALGALALAARPPDDEHNYGHDKAEYFASGVEGTLILLAAIGIIATSLPRLFNPEPLEQIGVGLAISLAASAVNLGVAQVLKRAGREHQSIVLEADSRHLMSDVWTSAGVIAGVGLVALTGWLWLDAAIALLVALNIIRSGWELVRRSFLGLMDSALLPDEVAQLEAILNRHRARGIDWHALRTRRSGSRAFITVHLLVPGSWTVQAGHDLIERIEGEMRAAIVGTTTLIHLEPLHDPRSLEDIPLDRG
jgi:cation diffusion facilitator family transporter